MRIMETRHFRQRWTKRVGAHDVALRKCVRRAVESGNVRQHPDESRGLMVAIIYHSRKLCVMAVPNGGDLYLRTVMSLGMAKKSGWREMKMDIPDELKKHTCGVCGEKCVPMTEGDGWYNPKKGVYEDVIVCSNCDRSLRELAYAVAATNTDGYTREDSLAWNLSSTTGSAAPSS